MKNFNKINRAFMAKKKHFALLCAFLCASMMAFATLQDTYLGCDGGLEAYANKYKWYSLDGATAPNEVVSIQRPSWDGLVECGIYVNVGVTYDGVKYDGSAVTTAEYCYIQGTGGILYISKFVNKCTTVEFTNGGSVVRGLRIQYDGGAGDACETGGGGSSFDPASIDWNNVDFITGQSQYKIYFTEENRPSNWETINIQTAPWADNHTGIYVTTPNGASACSLVDREGCWIEGAQVLMYLTAFVAEVTEVTITHASGTKTLYVYNANAGGGGGGPEPPAVTGICSSSTYASNVEGYAIHAQVTKGLNKYYLTLTSATDGKTLSGLNGVNMYCYQYGNESRSEDQRSNYHMAVSGRYSISEGAITFTIPSVGDPQMYTGLDVIFSDNQICSVNGLNGVRLEPCSTEDPVAYDPTPSEIEDTNFALSSNGAYAYASAVENGGKNAMIAIDGNNGSAFSTSHSDPQWFVVDLGQRRIFNTIQIRWQTAYSTAFTIDVSNDGVDWTNKVTESAYAGGDNVEYEAALGEDVTARFVRLNGTARATQWGHSFYEFRVLKKGIPVLTSVDFSSDKKIAKVGEYATLTASPKDQNNGAIAATLSYSVSPVAAGHVTDGKYYPDQYGYATITVTAEAGGNEVSNSVSVWGVMSDNLAANNALSADGTYTSDGGSDHLPAKVVDENGGTWWQGSANGESGAADEAARTYDAFYMVDLEGNYSVQLIKIDFDGACSDAYKIYVSTNQIDWLEAYNYAQVTGNNRHTKYISTAELNNSDNVRYIKFHSTKASTQWGVKIYEMEVYGVEASTTKTVSATVSPAASGSVVITAGEPAAVVESVESGTSVTFTATPAEGYDFVNWTQGGVEISTSATYVTTITANTALVANFEAHRTEYCSTLITDAGHSSELYVSIVNPSTNTYKILLEGTASQKIESAYDNIQLALTHINGESGTTYLPAASWTTDNSGYGSAYVTFTATDFRDITFVNKYITLNKQGGGLIEFDAFPNADLIKWDATCADNVAPELANPTAESIGSSQVRLTLYAIDDVAAVLTYHINYKPTGDEGDGENVDVVGASGETVHKVITGLTTSVEYTFTVTVSDAKPNTSAAKTCTATPTMPTAPVPTRDAAYVRSIYSDAYESVIVSNYGKNSYTGIEYSEQNIDDDHFILYNYATQKEIVWGADNENSDAMLAAEGYTYGTKKGLDVRGMNYIHFDVYSTTSTTYPNLYVQNVQFPFSVGDSGWQSFDINISNLDETVAQSITMLKFNDFRTPKPDEIAIDNVYFYAVPANINFGDDATDNTTTIAANANKFANVTINRNILADDTWYTLCLPFDMSAEKVSEVFGASTIATLVSSEDRGSLIHLNFDYVNAIQAGKPYLIKPGQDFVSGTTISNVTIQNVDPSAEGYKAIAEHMHFQGTFNKIMLTGEDKRYVSANNELYSPYPSGGSKIGAFRCYFTIPDGSSASAPGKQARIVFGPQTATGIDLINDSSKSNGKLLINGVLYIIRDGNTYNAQGMLVK